MAGIGGCLPAEDFRHRPEDGSASAASAPPGGGMGGEAGMAGGGEPAGEGGGEAGQGASGMGGMPVAGTGGTAGAIGPAGTGGAGAGGSGAGGTATFDAGSDPERNAVTAGRICERFAEIQCAGEAFCCDAPGRTVAACKQRQQSDCDTMAMVVALAAGRRVISAIPPGGRPLSLPFSEIERV